MKRRSFLRLVGAVIAAATLRPTRVASSALPPVGFQPLTFKGKPIVFDHAIDAQRYFTISRLATVIHTTAGDPQVIQTGPSLQNP